jgi:endonuclease/exonuclease/phosphatase family metal-dependent hydrolase
MKFVIATFNLENLDDKEDPENPNLWEKRLDVLKPMIWRINADLLFLQEVNSLTALDALCEGLPYEYHRAHTTKKDSNEPYADRNLVTLSHFPIRSTNQFRNDLVDKPMWKKVTAIDDSDTEPEAEEISWQRPILHCEIELPENRVLHAINLHLKSKKPTSIKGQQDPDKYWLWLSHEGWAEGYFLSTVKRVGQAFETRRLLNNIFVDNPEASIVIGGDLNSDIDSVPFKILTGSIADTNNPELHSSVMIPCEYNVPREQRYSLIHRGQGTMIDHILVSQTFYPYWIKTSIFNELLQDESIAFATDIKFPESDHAPVIAKFELPWD